MADLHDARSRPLEIAAPRAGRRVRRSLRIGRVTVSAIGRARRLFALRRAGDPSLEAAEGIEQVGFCRDLLEALEIDVERLGEPLSGGHLAVANHVSMLDVPVLAYKNPGLFVAKAEIGKWPLLGWLISSAGTLYITRERARDSLAVIGDIERAMDAGRRVVFFPEGTTTGGDALLRFRGSLFEAACRSGRPVQPVAICYPLGNDPATVHPAAPFVGDDTVLSHLWGLLGQSHLSARVHYLEPIEADPDRRRLAERTREAIAAALPSLRERS